MNSRTDHGVKQGNKVGQEGKGWKRTNTVYKYTFGSSAFLRYNDIGGKTWYIYTVLT